MDESRREAFFSYEPLGNNSVEEEPLSQVRLEQDPYGGPFWNDEGGLYEDYGDWEPYGMSRETFDACVRWNQGTADAVEKARLVQRLREELPPMIDIR